MRGHLFVRSPESWDRATAASDYWALGPLLAQLGGRQRIRRPREEAFQGETSELSLRVRRDALELAERFDNAVLSELVRRLLEIDPDRRPRREEIRDIVRAGPGRTHLQGEKGRGEPLRALTRLTKEEGVGVARTSDREGHMLLARVTEGRSVEIRWGQVGRSGVAAPAGSGFP